MRHLRRAPEEEERLPLLRVRRDHRGHWTRRTPTPTGSGAASRSSTSGRKRRRSPSPRVRTHFNHSERYTGSRRGPRTERAKTPPRRQPDRLTQVPRASSSKSDFLARLVICSHFADLVSQSGIAAVNALAEKLLRHKIGTPLEAFLLLALEKEKQAATKN